MSNEKDVHLISLEICKALAVAHPILKEFKNVFKLHTYLKENNISNVDIQEIYVSAKDNFVSDFNMDNTDLADLEKLMNFINSLKLAPDD